MVLLAIAVMRSTFYSGLRAEDDTPVAMTIPTQEKSHLRQLQVAFFIAKRPEMWYSMLSF